MTAAVDLPDGRRVILDPGLQGVLAVGLVTVDGLRVGPGDAVAPEREAVVADHRARWAGRAPAEIPPLQEARRLYHAVGIQPTRHRPSSEALLRRVLQGRDLYAINNAVDACNLASLTFLLPIGLYDRAKLRGDVTFRLGGPGEEYPGIRKGPVHLEGRLGLFDAAGPFGSPTSDSARTCIDDATCDLLGAVMATAAYPAADLAAHADLLADALVRHGGGRVTYRGLLGVGDDAP